MAHDVVDIFQNRVLLAGMLGWFIAQGLKVLLTLIMYKRFDIERFFGSGGMPSSHSAMVMALTVSVGRSVGFDSALFAVALIFATVVMYDASGVRRAAGKQARVLNNIVRELMTEGITALQGEELKELLGHTPVEVIAGAILGSIIALVIV